MKNNAPINIGNVNPSGRGMNGAVYDATGVSPTLTTNKGEGLKVRVSAPPLQSGGVIIYDDYNRRIKSDQTCIGTVMPNFKSDALGNGTKLIETERQSFRVRKLTPKECWRLMGFEDQDFENAKNGMNQNIYNGNDRSSSQLYKQAGNSIVVDVLLHIMENLYEAMPYLFEDIQIGSFFSGIGAFEKALDRLTPNAACDTAGEAKDLDLSQIGYINGYNGDANRIYDGSQISRALKAEAGGAEPRPDGIKYDA